MTAAGQRDRALGCLWGLAIGDALGMPTQLLSSSAIQQRYGAIEGFVAPADDHPIAAGLPAGSITDDTEQALILADLLDANGNLDQETWSAALQSWEEAAKARGSVDLLGPSTRSALAALRSGTPVALAGQHGTTNGASMRVAPVGIAVPPRPPERLLDAVVEASLLTHHTSVALAGAAAVAGYVSSRVQGAGHVVALDLAVQLAEGAAARGPWVAGADVARRIEWAVGEVSGMAEAKVPRFVSELVGTSLLTQESVPAAFAVLAGWPHDPWHAMCVAAGLGGDTDTIAAMVGAMAGAGSGVQALPVEAIHQVGVVNSLDLAPVVERLLELRRG